MFIVLFSLLVGGVMLFARFKEAQTTKENLEKAFNGKSYEVYDYSKYVRILYICLMILGFGSAIYAFMINDFESVAVGLIIGLIMLAEQLIIPYKYVLYYNDTHFAVGNKLSRYKSIKDFEELKFAKSFFVRAVTYNGETIPLSRKAYEIVKEHKEKKH